MTGFPRSPRLLKGALIGIDPANPIASVILFQYNPNTLTRSLQAQSAGSQSGSRAEVTRLNGAPQETINIEVTIDAIDQLEQGDATAGSLGIHPQLAALEMLLYPKTSLVVANTALMALGTIEVIPPVAPFTLFIWGPQRVLPVRLTDFRVTEDAHDPRLNPIRARVDLGLRVLSYSDFPVSHPGFHVFMAHQVVKETLATIASVNDLAATGSSFGL